MSLYINIDPVPLITWQAVLQTCKTGSSTFSKNHESIYTLVILFVGNIFEGAINTSLLNEF